MKRSCSLWLAAVSLCCAAGLEAATRPRYGGMLRVETRMAIETLDPAAALAPLALAQARDRLALLVFDCLVRLDGNGMPRPHLASAWQHDGGHRRWQFWLRRATLLHDGSALTPQDVADAFTKRHPQWMVRAVGDSVVIELDESNPELHVALARAENAIVVRRAGQLTGTGPFRVREFEPGRRAVLVAHDGHWGGRPYLDEIRVEMRRSLRDQLISLELGRADVVEVGVEEVVRARERGLRVLVSEPAELMAVQWHRQSAAAADPALREAMAMAMDRTSIQQVLLQGHGEAARGLLPQWISGYSFLFPVGPDLARARALRASRSHNPDLVLSFEPGDRLAQTMAERVAVNARDAGLRVQVVVGAANSDLRLVRIPLETAESAPALAAAAAALGAELGPHPASSEATYRAEQALLRDFLVVPLVHLPQAWGIGLQVRNWRQPRLGGWVLENLWLGAQPAPGAAAQ